eukprot:15479843-Alexandrium_andersonii.AAC.1
MRLQRCPRRVPVRDAATHGEKRFGFTHAAVICDEPSSQAALPQVLILPARLISCAEVDALNAEMPRNVFVL